MTFFAPTNEPERAYNPLLELLLRAVQIESAYIRIVNAR